MSSVSRFFTAAHPRIGHIREYAPQVTIACKPSSTIARFKNTEEEEVRSSVELLQIATA